MKTLFSGFYRPNEFEFKALWSNCIFSYDANVLINLYRYPEAARKRFLQVMASLVDRSTLTYQAALEYQERRVEQLASNAKAYREIESILEDALKKIHQYSQRHPFLDRTKVDSALERAVRQVKDEIRAAQGKHPKNLADVDPIHERLGELFDGRIGKEPSESDLIQIYQDGEIRYKKGIPPGFEDAKKPKEGRRYGDLVIWKQLIEIASQMNLSVIFVTDDRKEDWWQITQGETIGPRPELRQEFKKATGQDIYLYQPAAFLQRALEILKIQDNDSVEAIKGVGRKLASERQSEQAAFHLSTKEVAQNYENVMAALGVALASHRPERSLVSVWKNLPSHADSKHYWTWKEQVNDMIHQEKISVLLNSAIQQAKLINQIKASLDKEEVRSPDESGWLTGEVESEATGKDVATSSSQSSHTDAEADPLPSSSDGKKGASK